MGELIDFATIKFRRNIIIYVKDQLEKGKEVSPILINYVASLERKKELNR